MTSPEYRNGNVTAHCPDCNGALTTYENTEAGRNFARISQEKKHIFRDAKYNFIHYSLLRCAGCGRGGMATVHAGDPGAVLSEFFPLAIQYQALPEDVPPGIKSEFREAELCSSFQSNRGASALFRSVLEKTLKENGYIKGTLEKKIDDATAEGVLTMARSQRAHEDIRVLGNEVVHDEWRVVTSEEVELAHKYAHRILEDLYDDRPSVEKILKAKKRIPEE